MPHPLRTSVDDFIEGLKSLERETITTPLVRSFMDSTRVTADELQPYTFFNDKFYTRNLVFRDKIFEVMVIAWKPGQKTAVHTHNGQLGWMAVPQGQVSIHKYKYLSCNAPENQNVVGMDCLGGATFIDLERLDTEECYQEGGIHLVDKLQTIHQIENRDDAAAGCVTLHVYSLPFDSCIAFDLNQHRCYRKPLSYHSRYGHVEVDPPAASPAGGLVMPSLRTSFPS